MNQTDNFNQLIHSDTPMGFALFYAVTADMPLPAHCANWIWEMYYARERSLGTANEAFRGSLKTSIITDYFTAYQIGLHPERTNMFIQSSDDKAHSNAKFVSDLIENSLGWSICFPNVVPDKEMGWSTKGYYVKRTDISYGEWRMGKSKDPTLLGAGYKSKDVLGMHPSGLMIIDDINDYDNTSSTRELQGVIRRWESEIRPARIKSTWEIYNFTPWVLGDVGDKVKKTRRMHHIQTPVCANRDINKPTWPENYGPKELEIMREEHSIAEWARMFLLDLEAVKGAVLKREWLHKYPHTEIKEHWPVVIGVDYASVSSKQDTLERDYFALAVMKVVPNGGLILIDGVRKHVTQGEAEDLVMSWADDYDEQLQRVGIEALGKGEEFYYTMLRKASLPLKKVKVGNRSKAQRFEKGLAPLFRKGRIYISDAPDVPFIHYFTEEWISWDGEEKYPDDCIDAVYHGAVCAKGALKPDKEDDRGLQFSKRYQANPIAAFARR